MSRQRCLRVSYVLWLVSFLLLDAHTRLCAQETPTDTIKVYVDSVLATDTHRGMDASLQSSALGRRLKAVFDYSTYHLLRHQDNETSCGQAVAFNLPGGRILHVAPLDVGADGIAMELALFEGARIVMRTEAKMPENAALILVGPRESEQTFITTVRVEAIGEASEAASAPARPSRNQRPVTEASTPQPTTSPYLSLPDFNPAAPP